MIARTWHGVTPASKGEAYFVYLSESGVKEYRRTKGNRGVYILRCVEGDQAHFLLVSLWESMDAIRAFAGADVGKARYFPRDAEFLLEFEPTVAHYEVLAAPDAWRVSRAGSRAL